MCDKAVAEKGGTLKFAPDSYKKMCNQAQEMCDKVVYIFLSAIQFVSECFKTQEMDNKAVDICLFVFISVLIDTSV